MKRIDRDLQLTNELLQNQVQSLERQIGSKVIELQQHQENIQRQHHNYSSLIRQTDYDLKRKDEIIKRLEA